MYIYIIFHTYVKLPGGSRGWLTFRRSDRPEERRARERCHMEAVVFSKSRGTFCASKTPVAEEITTGWWFGNMTFIFPFSWEEESHLTNICQILKPPTSYY